MSLLSLFILVIAATKHAHGQACENTWAWTTPTGGSATTLSVGAPATFVASVDDDLVNGDIVVWKIGTAVQSTDTYDASGSTFTSTNAATGITTSYAAQADGTGNVYTMNIAALTIADHNGKSVTVESQTCDSGGVSPAVVLTVQYCDLDAFSSVTNPGTAADADVCGYNCVKVFTCTNDNTLTFEATCQADATWSTTTPAEAARCPCSWTWVAPTSAAMTKSVGAPATFVAAVDDVLVAGNVVVWKLDTTVQATGTYAAGSPATFTSGDALNGITISYAAQADGTGNEYTMNIAALTIADHNGTSVTVESPTCENNAVSTAVVLTVQYCDLTYFGAEGVAENDAVCGYNCTRNFACASGDKNFTATCQEDATWSPTTAPCGDAIRQGGVVALVILSTLVSMTQFF